LHHSVGAAPNERNLPLHARVAVVPLTAERMADRGEGGPAEEVRDQAIDPIIRSRSDQTVSNLAQGGGRRGAVFDPTDRFEERMNDSAAFASAHVIEFEEI